MAALYHSLFTEKGLELLRESIQNGTKLGITHMSFGDGGGMLPTPDAKFTQMVNEVYRVALNRLAPSKENPNWLEADGVIPSAVGGFNIREVGLWAGNDMVAYANYPPTYKPSGDQGTAQIKTIRIVLQIDNTANFELKIDASVVMATIQSVEEAKLEAIEFASKRILHIETTDDLALLSPDDVDIVYVKSRVQPNFSLVKPYKGGGEFIYDAGTVNINDGGLFFNGWVRQNAFEVQPEFYGAYADGYKDDYDAIQSALLSARPVKLDAETYCISKTLYAYSNLKLTGAGAKLSVIRKTTNTLAELDTIQNPQNIAVNYNVDAVLILLPLSKSFAKNITVQGIRLLRDLQEEGYGLFAPYLAESIFTDFQCWHGGVGFYNRNMWMCTLIRCQSHSKGGFVFGGYKGEEGGGGTSCTFLSCWATGVRENRWAYNVHLTDSTFSSCNSDYVGNDGNPAAGIWNIYDKSSVTINQTCFEVVHARQLILTENSVVNLIGVNTANVYNKYGSDNYLFDFSNSRIHFGLSEFSLAYTQAHAQFGEQTPNFIQAKNGSVVTVDNVYPYPRITGFNDGTRFQVRAVSSSKVRLITDGSIHEVSQGTNLAFPSNLEFIYSTNKKLKTSSDIEAKNIYATELDGNFGNNNPNAGFWNKGCIQLGSYYIWVDNERSGLRMKQGKPSSNLDGYPVSGFNRALSGSTINRPTTSLFTGLTYFDTDLMKPVTYWTNVGWRDANGNTV
ncbi:phage tail-collar fiber domain-containing protein [Acinetobacter baumannii]|uniref:phage tail-collar fiber domain-containing protein n=1 Tax=Acinetobacter baumannii TaxID=470 RepID=UPI001D172193|nr:phage tail protein [Acinetobacter baumannii]